MLLWEHRHRTPRRHGATPGSSRGERSLRCAPRQQYSLRAKVGGGSADHGDHSSQHVLLQQRLAQERLCAHCRQQEGRDLVLPICSSAPCRGQQGPQCPRLPAGGTSGALQSPRSSGSRCWPLPGSSPAPTLHGSLHGHGQHTGHHGLVEVPAALRVLLALQGHAVQALARGDHLLGTASLAPCRAQALSHHTAAARTPCRCRQHPGAATTSKKPSSCPDTRCPAACSRLRYLSAPSGDAAAGRGRSPSRCWCAWTRLPGPAGSAAAGSGGPGISPPPALRGKHTSGGC